MKKKQNKLFTLIIVLLVVIGGSLYLLNFFENESSSETISGEEQLEKVSFRMNWIPYAEHVPVYVAKDLGYYEEEGFDVDIVHGKGSTLSAKLVASGDNEFGMCSGDTALMSKIKGLPLKVVAVMLQKSPVEAVTLKENNILRPKQLEGKKIGVNVQSTKYQQFKAFSKINDVDTSTITEVHLEPAAEPPALLDGTVDALLDYNFDAAADFKYNGHEINEILFEDYGVHVYSSSLITNEEYLNNNPDSVERFTRATLKGWEYSIAHPKEAVDIFIKYNPENDKDIELVKFNNMISLTESSVTEANGLGYQSEKNWEDTQDLLYGLELIDEKIDVGELFTNEFLS